MPIDHVKAETASFCVLRILLLWLNRPFSVYKVIYENIQQSKDIKGQGF